MPIVMSVSDDSIERIANGQHNTMKLIDEINGFLIIETKHHIYWAAKNGPKYAAREDEHAYYRAYDDWALIADMRRRMPL